MKNKTQQKKIKQQSHKKDLFPLIEKENLTDKKFLQVHKQMIQNTQ